MSSYKAPSIMVETWYMFFYSLKYNCYVIFSMTLTFFHLFPVYIYKHKMWTLVLLFTVLKCFGCFGLIQIFKNIVCSGALCYSDGVEVGRRANQDRWEEVILRNSLHQQPGGRTALLCHPFEEKAIHMYGFDLLSVSWSVMLS